MGHVGSTQRNSVGFYSFNAEGGLCDKVRLNRFVWFIFLVYFYVFKYTRLGRSSLPGPCNIRIFDLFGNLADCDRFFDKEYDCDSF
jgi:hypothetical protein